MAIAVEVGPGPCPFRGDRGRRVEHLPAPDGPGLGRDGVGAELAQLGEEPDEVDEVGPGHRVGQAGGHQGAAGLLLLDRGRSGMRDLAVLGVAEDQFR